jgi:hypothetical protein
MAHTNPGEPFIQRYGIPQELSDILRYADFLRNESNTGLKLPIDLEGIFNYFEFPPRKRVPLPGQQGVLVNSDLGWIVINQDDPAMRQRFTEAHELIEELFSAMPSGPGLRPEVKERWCDAGAAELLMPMTIFRSRVQALGASIDTARSLATLFQVSLTASLRQMIRASDQPHAIVIWRMKHKPSERTAVHNSTAQLTLFEEMTSSTPSPKLRVEWSERNGRGPFIPVDKSIDENSAVYTAWRDGIYTAGTDVFNLNNNGFRFYGENQPFWNDDSRQVLSLITVTH